MAKISWKRNALFWGLFVSIIRGFVGQATRSDLKIRKSAFSTCLGKNGNPRPSTGGQAAASIQDEPGDCRADSERERSSWCGGGSGSCRTPPKVFALAQFLSRVEPRLCGAWESSPDFSHSMNNPPLLSGLAATKSLPQDPRPEGPCRDVNFTSRRRVKFTD